MPLADPPRPSQELKTPAEITDYLIGFVRWFSDFINHIDTLNVEELSADVINAGTILAALVTIKSNLTGGAFIQIDGTGMIINDGTKDVFKVDINGLVTMTGAVMKSANSNEKVTIDSTGFHSYDSSGVERITIGTTPAKGAKAIVGRDSSGTEQSVYTYDTETVDGASRTGQFMTAHGAYILLSNDGDVRIQAADGKGFRAVSGTPEMSDGFGWYTIAKKDATTSTNGFHDHGIDAGVKLATTTDGSTVSGYVTWVPSGNHNHTQS